MKWILAAGILIAVLAIAVSWYRGGDDGVRDRGAARLGERQHRVIPADAGGRATPHPPPASGRIAGRARLARADDALETGGHPPAVLLVDGGDHSYYHDRDDFDVGHAHPREAIPAARRATGHRPAQGGDRRLLDGRLRRPRPARQRALLRRRGALACSLEGGGQTPEGAFDDAEDFERHDVSGSRRTGRACSAARGCGSMLVARTASGNTVLLGELVDSPAKTPPGEHSTAVLARPCRRVPPVLRQRR